MGLNCEALKTSLTALVSLGVMDLFPKGNFKIKYLLCIKPINVIYIDVKLNNIYYKFP
jgi:hypothetical protein